MPITNAAERLTARRTIIRIAQTRCKPGSGTHPDVLRERTMRMRFPDLGTVLQGVPYAVVGAAATRLYMPERATSDLDIAIATGQSGVVTDRLLAAAYRFSGHLAVGGTSWLTPEGFPVDVLELQHPWVWAALGEAAANMDPHGMPIIALPYLVLLKLESGRAQDVADLSRMLGQADDEALARVRAAVSRYQPDAANDVESLISLGRLELADS